MKKKWLFMFSLDLYLIQVFIILFALAPFLKSIIGYLLLAFLGVSFILAVANIVCAIKMPKDISLQSKKDNPMKSVMKFKLGLIPFFVIHFVFWFSLALASLNPFLMLLWLFIPLGILYAYMVLLVTSAYSISQIFILRRNGVLTNGQCILHIMLHFSFVLDVVDSIYICRKYQTYLQGGE